MEENKMAKIPGEFFDLESVYLDFNALLNLLDVWAQNQAMLEVALLLEKLRDRNNDFKNILKEKLG